VLVKFVGWMLKCMECGACIRSRFPFVRSDLSLS